MFTILFIIMALTFCLMVGSIAHRAMTGPKAKKELGGKTSDDTDEPLACEALVTRVFEQRLVEAGIMEVIDMTTCENQQCADCMPTNLAKWSAERCAVVTCRLKGETRWNENEMLCKKHYDIRKKDEVKTKALASKPKTITLPNNSSVSWPTSVPTYASHTIHADSAGRGSYAGYVIEFRWTDPATGLTQGQRMMVPDFIHTSGRLTPERRAAAVKALTRKEKIEHIRKVQKKNKEVKLSLPVLGSKEREERAARREEYYRNLRANPPKPPRGPGGGSPTPVDKGRWV